MRNRIIYFFSILIIFIFLIFFSQKRNSENKILKVNIDFKNVNNNLNNLLLEKVKLDLEGKCNENGFVKNDSIKILSYSSGEL